MMQATRSMATRIGQIEDIVQRRLGGRVRDLHVEFRGDGVIILQGRTHTYHAKQLAQHAVMELDDMSVLSNDIQVC